MSHARLLLLLIVTFLLTTVVGYFAVGGAILGYWELTGVHDQDGGGAMAVGLVIAPVGALIIGVLATAATWPVLAKRQRALAPPATGVAGRDTRVLFAVAGLIAGVVAGAVVASALQATLKPYIYDIRPAFWLFERAHEICMPLCGVIGATFASIATRSQHA
ncbi:MAG: hypothetical protein U0Q11_17670 [Vicinamibacterales bacterium]